MRKNLVSAILLMLAAAAPRDASLTAPPSAEISPSTKPHLDRSGAKQVGKASFYKSSYGGKKMADGMLLAVGHLI